MVSAPGLSTGVFGSGMLGLVLGSCGSGAEWGGGNNGKVGVLLASFHRSPVCYPSHNILDVSSTSPVFWEPDHRTVQHKEAQVWMAFLCGGV